MKHEIKNCWNEICLFANVKTHSRHRKDDQFFMNHFNLVLHESISWVNCSSHLHHCLKFFPFLFTIIHNLWDVPKLLICLQFIVIWSMLVGVIITPANIDMHAIWNLCYSLTNLKLSCPGCGFWTGPCFIFLAQPTHVLVVFLATLT